MFTRVALTLGALLTMTSAASADWTSHHTVSWIKFRSNRTEIALDGVSSSKCGSSSKVARIQQSAGTFSEMSSAALAAKLSGKKVSLLYNNSTCDVSVVMFDE